MPNCLAVAMGRQHFDHLPLPLKGAFRREGPMPMKSSLKEGIDERSDGRALGDNHQKAEEDEENKHRHQPPQLPRPKKLQQFGGNAKAPEHTAHV